MSADPRLLQFAALLSESLGTSPEAIDEMARLVDLDSAEIETHLRGPDAAANRADSPRHEFVVQEPRAQGLSVTEMPEIERVMRWFQHTRKASLIPRQISAYRTKSSDPQFQAELRKLETRLKSELPADIWSETCRICGSTAEIGGGAAWLCRPCAEASLRRAFDDSETSVCAMCEYETAVAEQVAPQICSKCASFTRLLIDRL